MYVALLGLFLSADPEFVIHLPVIVPVNDIALEPYSRYPNYGKDSPHENSHYINAHIRNQYKGYNAVYVIGGFALTVQEPPFTLTDIARKIPSNFRGGRL